MVIIIASPILANLNKLKHGSRTQTSIMELLNLRWHGELLSQNKLCTTYNKYAVYVYKQPTIFG